MDLSREFILAQYETFASDLVRISEFDRLADQIGRMYHGEERRILYLMLRAFRPEIVVEFSPNQGWSTLHMARALEDNGIGRIYSFELDPRNVETAQRVLAACNLAHCVEFFVGDVRHTLPPVLNALGQLVDFLFVDSDHSYPFARWWLTKVLPAVRTGGLVHVHDVEHSFRYGWDALTMTHQGGGVYGPPPRRFMRPTRLQRSAWKGRLTRRLPLWARKFLVSPEVRSALDQVYYTPGVSAVDITSSNGPGEALAVKEFLDRQNGNIEWLSVMALAEDPSYRQSVAPYGGGNVSEWPDPWGYERSPTLYFIKQER